MVYSALTSFRWYVLLRQEYEEEHLPGANNIPLKELDREAIAQLNRSAPVIVYGHDYQ